MFGGTFFCKRCYTLFDNVGNIALLCKKILNDMRRTIFVMVAMVIAIAAFGTNKHGKKKGEGAAYEVRLSAGTPQVLFDTKASDVPYRIPSIVMSKKGELVAIADYRIDGNDIGNKHIDIVCKRSEDNGRTWSVEDLPVVRCNRGVSEGFEYAYGDACTVCDGKSGRILLMCAAGSTGFWGGGTAVGRYYSEDGGKTWTGGEMTVENGLPEVIATKKFYTSGRICQSKRVKAKGAKYYRIYAGVCCSINGGSYIVYSDDFGESWHILGDSFAYAGGDETAVEELPDGSVLASARIYGSNGRGFNVFRYSDGDFQSGQWAGEKKSAITASMCNGEVLLMPTRFRGVHVLLQSVPMSNQREKVGIYYKVIDTNDASADFTNPEFYNTFDGSIQISNTTSCYSTMTIQKDGRVAFLYEDELNEGDSHFPAQAYQVKYLPIKVEVRK